jgi:hypothetical protein
MKSKRLWESGKESSANLTSLCVVVFVLGHVWHLSFPCRMIRSGPLRSTRQASSDIPPSPWSSLSAL